MWPPDVQFYAGLPPIPPIIDQSLPPHDDDHHRDNEKSSQTLLRCGNLLGFALLTWKLILIFVYIFNPTIYADFTWIYIYFPPDEAIAGKVTQPRQSTISQLCRATSSSFLVSWNWASFKNNCDTIFILSFFGQPSEEEKLNILVKIPRLYVKLFMHMILV